MTDLCMMKLRKIIRITKEYYAPGKSCKSYAIRRASWSENIAVMIPTVTNNPLVMINTSTLRTVDYTPSVSDILAVDWEVVK